MGVAELYRWNMPCCIAKEKRVLLIFGAYELLTRKKLSKLTQETPASNHIDGSAFIEMYDSIMQSRSSYKLLGFFLENLYIRK